MINRDRLATLRAKEDARFLELHPKSGEMFKAGQVNMPGGVPMSWMAKWPGAYPVFVSQAKGARFSDVDGNTYICLLYTSPSPRDRTRSRMPSSA